MVRDVLGSLLLLGGALWLWLGLVQAQRRQLRLLEELAASLEQMASAIRFRRETLLRLLAAAPIGGTVLWSGAGGAGGGHLFSGGMAAGLCGSLRGGWSYPAAAGAGGGRAEDIG